MFQTLKLLLPVLIPSWRFFDVIAPSPRIKFRHLKNKQDTMQSWQELRPRSVHLSFLEMLKRMIWNLRWNETLFLVSCAERLMNGEEAFAREEIFQRIQNEINEDGFIQFRLVFHVREGKDVQTHNAYISPIRCLGRVA